MRDQACRSRSMKVRQAGRARGFPRHASPRAQRRGISARARSWKMGWPMGLEPTTTGITTLDSTFELRPPSQAFTGLPGGTRTHNPQLRRLVLYPVELRAATGQTRKNLVGVA